MFSLGDTDWLWTCIVVFYLLLLSFDRKQQWHRWAMFFPSLLGMLSTDMLCIAKRGWFEEKQDSDRSNQLGRLKNSMATKEALVSEWLRGNGGTAGNSETQHMRVPSH